MTGPLDAWAAKVDAVLAEGGMQTAGMEVDSETEGLGPANQIDGAVAEAVIVESPVGPLTAWEREIARAAWEDLTGDGDLPEWFDEMATVTELARRSGRSPSEVRAALDSIPRHATRSHRFDELILETWRQIERMRISHASANTPIHQLLIFGRLLEGWQADELQEWADAGGPRGQIEPWVRQADELVEMLRTEDIADLTWPSPSEGETIATRWLDARGRWTWDGEDSTSGPQGPRPDASGRGDGR